MEEGVLPLNKKVIDLLKVKHPVGKAASEDTQLHGPLPTIDNIIFDVIEDSVVLEVLVRDGCRWRRMETNGDYGDESWYQETMVM